MQSGRRAVGPKLASNELQLLPWGPQQGLDKAGPRGPCSSEIPRLAHDPNAQDLTLFAPTSLSPMTSVSRMLGPEMSRGELGASISRMFSIFLGPGSSAGPAVPSQSPPLPCPCSMIKVSTKAGDPLLPHGTLNPKPQACSLSHEWLIQAPVPMRLWLPVLGIPVAASDSLFALAGWWGSTVGV